MTTPKELTYLSVLGVDPRMSEYDLFKLFDEHGTVDTLIIPKERSRRFAYVRFEQEADAQAVKRKLNGREFHGERISVQFSEDGPEGDYILNSMSDFASQERDKVTPKEGHRTRKLTNSYSRFDYDKDREMERKKDKECEKERQRAEANERGCSRF